MKILINVAMLGKFVIERGSKMRKKISLIAVLVLNSVALVLAIINLLTVHLISTVFGRAYTSSTKLSEDASTIQYSLSLIKFYTESFDRFLLLALFTIGVIMIIYGSIFIEKRKTGIFLILFSFSKLTDYLLFIYNLKIAMTALWFVEMIGNSSFYFSLTFKTSFILSSFLLPIVLLVEGIILLFSSDGHTKNYKYQKINYIIDNLTNLPVLSTFAITFLGIVVVGLSGTFSVFFSKFAFLWYLFFIVFNVVLYSFVNFFLTKISEKKESIKPEQKSSENISSLKIPVIKIIFAFFAFVIFYFYSVAFWNCNVTEVSVKTTIEIFEFSIPTTDYISFTFAKSLYVIFLLFYVPLIALEAIKYWQFNTEKRFLFFKNITKQIAIKNSSPTQIKKIIFTLLLILLLCIPYPLLSFLSYLSHYNLLDGGKIFYAQWEANSTITIDQMNVYSNGTFSCTINVSSYSFNFPAGLDLRIIIFNSLIYDTNNNGYFDSCSYIYSVNSTPSNSQISITQEENYSQVAINSTGLFSIVGKLNATFSSGDELLLTFAYVRDISQEEYNIVSSPVTSIVKQSH